MADDVYTTLLNFVSDSSDANRDIKQTTENLKKMEEQVKRVSFEPAKLAPLGERGVLAGIKKEFKDLENIANQAGIRISAGLRRALTKTGVVTEADLQEARSIAEQIERINELRQAKQQELRETIIAHRQKALLYNREASILAKTAADIRQNAGILRNQAQQLASVSQLALGLGGGVVGGIFAFASKYVRDAKEATEVTLAWKTAQDSLGKSGQRIGAVLAQEALPLLRLAAQTAEKAAGFIEKHPEIVRAALNTGIVVAGLGAVGLAVSKGIKLYADQLYLSSIPLQLRAGELQFAAAQEQLAAARLKAGLPAGAATPTPSPNPASGLGLAPALLAATAVIVIGVIVAKYAVDLTNLVLEKTGATKAIADAQRRIQETSRRPYPGIITGARPQAGASTSTSLEPPTGVRASAQFESILKAYEDYKKEDLLLVQKHYAERQKTISDSLQAEAKENAEFARNSARIRSQLGKSIAEATRSYEEQSIQAERQYAQERANIIRDSGIEIQRIEEQLQENLRKMRQDHEDRLEDLVSSRDALGIVKEQQRYDRERSETIRAANLEIRQRREDLALRLSDLQNNYVQERAQRFEEFQARLEELRANAREQLKELAARHQEELAEIRAQRAQRIKELDDQLKEERQRRYDYFVAQIRDLDANLLGEAELRKRRQEEMIAELDNFLQRYNSGLKSLLTVPTGKAAGGYATYGTYLLGDRAGGGRGKTEYVLGGDVTELAERVLGGHLSQEKMMALLNAVNGGSRKNVVYNDSRQIDSRISNADRERMIDDTIGAVTLALE